MAVNYSGKKFHTLAEVAALYKLFITKSNNIFITNDNDNDSLLMLWINGHAKRSSLV